MPVLFARAAAIGGANTIHWPAIFGVIAVAITTAGCSVTPLPHAAAAANAEIAVPAARYTSVTAPYAQRHPVEPLPWRQQNERVAPQSVQ